MPTVNERLKAMLHDARLVYLSKLRFVQDRYGMSNAELALISGKMDATMRHFDNPSIWAHPIPYEEAALLKFTVDIDNCDPADLALFLDVAKGFIGYLEEELFLHPVIELEAEPQVDYLNYLQLEALLQAQRNITGKKIYFRNRDIDLKNHSEFNALEQEHKLVLAAYRKALINNEVKATEADNILFKRIGSAIKETAEINTFLEIYALMTESMSKKTPLDNPSDA